MVRNGYLPKRTITTGVGPVEVAAAAGARSTSGRRSGAFLLEDSAALPAQDQEHRRVDSLAVPQRHQHGRLQRSPAGAGGPGLPGPVGLDGHAAQRRVWEDEFQEWNRSDPWKTSSTSTCGPTACISTSAWKKIGSASWCLMGATADGKKELIAVADGFRESEQSWKELLLDVKARGLVVDPKLATGDGALGLLEGVAAGLSDDTRAALLGPQDGQRARQAAQAIAARGQREDSRDLDGRHRASMPNRRSTCSWQPTRPSIPRRPSAWRRIATCCLTFYDFPAEHWIHLRTTNPIESTFATVRLRHRRTKGSGSRTACLTMVFKLMQSASKKMAAAERLATAARRHRRNSIHRRNQTPRSRRLKKFLIHNFCNISANLEFLLVELLRNGRVRISCPIHRSNECARCLRIRRIPGTNPSIHSMLQLSYCGRHFGSNNQYAQHLPKIMQLERLEIFVRD